MNMNIMSPAHLDTQLYHQASSYYKQEKWEQAIDCCYRLIEQGIDSWQVYRLLGDVFMASQQWEKSIQAYQIVLVDRCDDDWTWHNLAVAWGYLGNWNETENCYRALEQINPRFLESTQGKILLSHQVLRQEVYQYQEKGEWLQAFLCYQTLLKSKAEIGTKKLNFLPNTTHALPDLPIFGEKWEKILGDYHQASLGNSELSQVLDQFAKATVELITTVNRLPVPQPLVLPRSQTPNVSIIIPVYNKIDYTYRCLESLARNISLETQVEIIVVNDCSTDNTVGVLERVNGLVLVNNSENLGFIRSCNQGASASKGKYLYFLNNDTEIRPRCIEELIAVLEKDQTVGAVGSKLIYPDGALQESGGIIWDDASGWNYGRMQNPFDPKYNYLRPVDYCSAASLLVRRSCFEQLGGFEQKFIPAYYEDTDLCFGIRNVLGLQAVVQPKSEVIHYEGVSSGTSTSSGVKRYQIVNQEKFQKKWQSELGQHLPNQEAELVEKAARRYLGGQTILIINPYPPCYDKESGARRLFEIVKIFKQLHYHVIFAPENGLKEEPYVSELQNLQVEVLYTQPGYGTLVMEQIQERLPLVDFAWICFPDMVERYLPLLQEHSHIKVIYDTIDLHHVRMKREWEMQSGLRNIDRAREWAEMQALEINLAHQADLTVTVTSIEKDVLQGYGVDNISVIPNIHIPHTQSSPSFEQRQNLLFIGGYRHTPNIDGVCWLCSEIMPIVWQHLPELTVTLLGSHPTDEVKKLGNNDHRIIIPGYVEDVTPYFLSHRVFVVPLRYGAGMKGKVGQSLEYRLPIVSTSIGAEGMNLIDGQHVLVADDIETFASQIFKLYTDADLWRILAANSLEAISPYSPESIEAQMEQLMFQLSI